MHTSKKVIDKKLPQSYLPISFTIDDNRRRNIEHLRFVRHHFYLSLRQGYYCLVKNSLPNGIFMLYLCRAGNNGKMLFEDLGCVASIVTPRQVIVKT